MGKKSRVKARSAESTPRGEVGPREPCPCGSGRRYKACHGSSTGAPATWSARPFEGLSGECDLIALREFVPAATAPLRLKGSDREVLLCSLLPGAAPALVRAGGAVWLGLQVQHAYGDPSRDLAAVLVSALEAEPGNLVGLPADPGVGDRLQDLVEGDLEVTVHDGFGFWADDADDADDNDAGTAATLEQANWAASPTTRLPASRRRTGRPWGSVSSCVGSARSGEDALLDALARLHAAARTTSSRVPA